MPVPNMDPHDNPQRPKDEAAEESLDAFEGEPAKFTELVEWAGDDDPLAAFAAEPTRFEFLEPRERFERLARSARLE